MTRGQYKLLLVVVWVVLAGGALFIMKLGYDVVRRPQRIAAERYPYVVPSTTRPLDSTEAMMVQELLIRKYNWGAKQTQKFEEARQRRPVGIFLLALGAMLIAAWTAGGVWLWTSAKDSTGTARGRG